MLRHLCLLAAAAAATTTQNATRQLDAYAPPATDLSRACASWRPDRSDVDRVRTIRAGNFVNLAHATGGAFVASVSKVRRPPKGQNCRKRGGDDYIDRIATLAGFSADHFSQGEKATQLAVVLLSTSIPCDVDGQLEPTGAE